MVIMDWKECSKKELVKAVCIDRHMISSLLLSSERKLESQGLLPLNDVTSGSKITLCYDAMRELLEAIALSKGYKIYNHECYCAFLKEILDKSEMGDKFDQFRKARNAINYYGRSFTKEEANAILENMKSFIFILRFSFFPKS